MFGHKSQVIRWRVAAVGGRVGWHMSREMARDGGSLVGVSQTTAWNENGLSENLRTVHGSMLGPISWCKTSWKLDFSDWERNAADARQEKRWQGAPRSQSAIQVKGWCECFAFFFHSVFGSIGVFWRFGQPGFQKLMNIQQLSQMQMFSVYFSHYALKKKMGHMYIPFAIFVVGFRWKFWRKSHRCQDDVACVFLCTSPFMLIKSWSKENSWIWFQANAFKQQHAILYCNTVLCVFLVHLHICLFL